MALAPPTSTNEPDADCFRAGDVWLNSRGTQHRVIRVVARVAHLVNEATGRTTSRPWDAIGAHTGAPWVRVSSGGQEAAAPAAARPRERG